VWLYSWMASPAAPSRFEAAYPPPAPFRNEVEKRDAARDITNLRKDSSAVFRRIGRAGAPRELVDRMLQAAIALWLWLTECPECDRDVEAGPVNTLPSTTFAADR